MVVGDFNLIHVPGAPNEADPKLIVDADCVLALPIARQRVQLIMRRQAQFFEAYRSIEELQLAFCDISQVRGRPSG
jgi:hypothetical protein